MTLEGAIAILAGVLAGSVALIGFGIDSAIEGFASAIIVWRFTGARMFSAHAEQRAQKLVALQFFILAPYVGFESIQALVQSERPGVSWLGIALSASSLIVMPYLGVAKQRIADQIGSAATKGEGRQNMLCAYLAAALLVGLLANAAFGAWWLDPIVGLLIAAVAVREGLEAWRGEGCSCTADPLVALRKESAQDACAQRAGDHRGHRAVRAPSTRHEAPAEPGVTLEVLYFDGCPSHERLLPVLRDLAGEHGLAVSQRRIDSAADAEHARFLGSPSVRVNGVDVEPGAHQRTDFGLKCRLYRSPAGQSGLPPQRWIADALQQASTR